MFASKNYVRIRLVSSNLKMHNRNTTWLQLVVRMNMKMLVERKMPISLIHDEKRTLTLNSVRRMQSMPVPIEKHRIILTSKNSVVRMRWTFSAKRQKSLVRICKQCNNTSRKWQRRNIRKRWLV